jgi:hypothetical protein
MNTLLPLAVSFLVTMELLCSAVIFYFVVRGGGVVRAPLDIRLGWIGCAITLAIAIIALRKKIDPRWLFLTSIILTAAVALGILAAGLFGFVIN